MGKDRVLYFLKQSTLNRLTMAKGKNKQSSKKGSGGRGKAERHAFFKKKWYKLQSPPSVGNSVCVGWLPCNKTIGTKLSKDNLMGRVADVSLGDIQENTAFQYKRVKMQVEEVKGNTCYSSFHGIGMIREKLYTFLRKKMSLIDVVADVKTSDGYILRVLITTFTSRKQGQLKTNTYAKTSQIRAIRKVFVKYLAKVAANNTIADFASNALNDQLSTRLLEKGKRIFPLSTVLVRKVKVLKKSKIDLAKLVNDTNAKKEDGNVGKKGNDVGREAEEAKNQLE